jgi:hypothetical protein
MIRDCFNGFLLFGFKPWSYCRPNATAADDAIVATADATCVVTADDEATVADADTAFVTVDTAFAAYTAACNVYKAACTANAAAQAAVNADVTNNNTIDPDYDDNVASFDALVAAHEDALYVFIATHAAALYARAAMRDTRTVYKAALEAAFADDAVNVVVYSCMDDTFTEEIYTIASSEVAAAREAIKAIEAAEAAEAAEAVEAAEAAANAEFRRVYSIDRYYPTSNYRNTYTEEDWETFAGLSDYTRADWSYVSGEIYALREERLKMLTIHADMTNAHHHTVSVSDTMERCNNVATIAHKHTSSQHTCIVLECLRSFALAHIQASRVEIMKELVAIATASENIETARTAETNYVASWERFGVFITENIL